LKEACYAVDAPDLRTTRKLLEVQPGVVAVQPAGADLHLFLDNSVTTIEQLAAKVPFSYKQIQPSLEDVFIALVRKEGTPRAA
jgi:hypothetical protein